MLQQKQQKGFFLNRVGAAGLVVVLSSQGDGGGGAAVGVQWELLRLREHRGNTVFPLPPPTGQRG